MATKTSHLLRPLVALAALVAAMAAILIAYNASPARAALDSCTTIGETTTCTFVPSGSEDTFEVPVGVSSVRVVATGAPGAVGGALGGVASGPAGRGATVSGDLTITPGQKLYVNVGGAPTGDPTGSICRANVACVGGFNGGGSSSSASSGFGGGGGGASDVRTVATPSTGDQGESLNSRLIVAGGGGGSGGWRGCGIDGPILPGGAGGDAGSDGGDGTPCSDTPGTGGDAGSQSAGGSGGSPDGHSGSLGLGGNGGGSFGGSGFGGGGGGGYYGGGGGGSINGDSPAGGGGGGSNLVPTGGTATIATTTGPSITISYTVTPVNDAPTVTVARGGECGPASDMRGTINLALSDPDTPAQDLTLSPSSSNTAVVPNGAISFGGGTDASRTMTVGRLTGTGTSTLTVTVSDGDQEGSVVVRVISGSAANDTLTGGDNSDMIFARKGRDTLSAQGANDLLCAGNGRDLLTGGNGADHFGGGQGIDTATDFDAAEAEGDTKRGIENF